MPSWFIDVLGNKPINDDKKTDPGECVASVTNGSLGLETAMAPTVIRG